MTPQYSVHDSPSRSSGSAPSARLYVVKRPVLRRSTRAGALCALAGLASAMLVAPTEASAAPFGAGPFAPGNVVISQAVADETRIVFSGSAIRRCACKLSAAGESVAQISVQVSSSNFTCHPPRA